MTILEAGQRLGLSRNGMQRYVRRLELKIEWHVTAKNAYYRCNITEADLKAIAAEHRRSVFAHSETKSKTMQRVSFKYRKQAIANRDPEEWRRSLAKAVRAAAEKRRKLAGVARTARRASLRL